METLSLRQRFLRDMQLKGFADDTQQNYLSHIIRYVKYYMKKPEELNEQHIKEYLHSLVKEGKSTSSINQSYSALRFLYETTLKTDWESFKIPRSKKRKKLPVALGRDEISMLLKSVDKLKYKAMFELMYCGGLRVSEVVELKATDINSKDMTIFVEDGKGGKDRYTVLSHKALETLKSYYQLNGYLKKCKWLFPGSDINKPISTRSIQKKFSDLKKILSLNPKSTVHSIRHGFATHMLEAGVDVYHLQKLMGHSSVQTTTIYIHISSVKAVNVISPHDTLTED